MNKKVELQLDWGKYPWAKYASQDRSGSIHVFRQLPSRTDYGKFWYPFIEGESEFVRQDPPNKWWSHSLTHSPLWYKKIGDNYEQIKFDELFLESLRKQGF